jgi:hypothetical protein
MILRPIALGLLTTAIASPAFASAWTKPQGTGEVIVTSINTTSHRGYDTDGNTQDIPDYDKSEVYVLAEYGVTDDLTVMATPSFSDVHTQGPGGDTSGLGYTELGARYRLAHSDGSVFSVQGTVRLRGERRRDTLGQVSADGNEYDLRLLGGTSFVLAGMNGFVDVQGGYRLRDRAPPNEFHADATLGIRPAQSLLLMAQSFTTISDGAGAAGFPKYRYSNIYVSGVVDVTSSLSLQAGGIATIAGRNALRERGFLAGVWYRF